MLDLGANTECDAQNLVQFAVMGSAYARTRARHPQAAREAAQHRHRGTEGHRRAQGRGRAAARSRLSAVPLRRLHRRRPAVARRRRRRRDRRLFGQHRAQDRRRDRALRHRSAAARLQELASVEGRLRAVAPGAEPAQAPPRPEQPQRRGLPRAQRPGREEPRRATPKGVANAIGVAARMVRNDIIRKIGDDLDNFRAHAFANEAAQ